MLRLIVPSALFPGACFPAAQPLNDIVPRKTQL